MADIKGLLADPQFNQLDHATQRQVLGRMDPVLGQLSEPDYQTFRLRMGGTSAPGTPPLPYMLQPGVPTPSTGTETEERQKYYDTYHQDPGPGFMHNKQGTEEFLGASIAGTGAPAITAGVEGGLGAGISALGHSIKKAAVDALTGAVSGYVAQKGTHALGVPDWLSDAAGLAAGMYGWSKADLIQNFMKETLDKGEVPSLSKFVKWSAERANGPTPIEPVAPEPFKPNPNIVRQMRYPGPMEPEYSPAAPLKVSRWVPPVDEVQQPQAPAPFRPNPAIARRFSQSGGPIEPVYNPASPMPPLQGAPETPLTPAGQAEPQVQGTFKINPRLAEKMRRGGSPFTEEYGGPPSSSGRRGINRAIAPVGDPEPAVESTTTTGGQSTVVVPKGEAEAMTDAEKWADLNRAIHRHATRLDLPNSPAGAKTPTGYISGEAQRIFGKDYLKLSPEEMSRFLVKGLPGLSEKFKQGQIPPVK